jgi:hypothetical protein
VIETVFKYALVAVAVGPLIVVTAIFLRVAWNILRGDV